MTCFIPVPEQLTRRLLIPTGSAFRRPSKPLGCLATSSGRRAARDNHVVRMGEEMNPRHQTRSPPLTVFGKVEIINPPACRCIDGYARCPPVTSLKPPHGPGADPLRPSFGASWRRG